VVVLALLLEAGRVVLSGGWLPQSTISAVCLTTSLLFLLPLGIMLLLVGVACAIRPRLDQPREAGVHSVWSPRQRVLAILVPLAFTALAVTVPAYRSLSARLDWGRYGLPPPVEVMDLADVTEATGLEFPRSAMLLDGEFMAGIVPYLIAEVALDRGQVQQFLQAEAIRKGTISRSRSGTAELTRVVPWGLYGGRGWIPLKAKNIIWAPIQPLEAGMLADVLIDIDNPDIALVYIHWESDVPRWVW
jgi:hypothetical protein